MFAKSLSSLDMVVAMAFFSLIGPAWLVIVLGALLSFFIIIKRDAPTVAVCLALVWVSLVNPMALFYLLLAKSFVFFSFNYFTFLDIASAAAGAAALAFGTLTAVASVMMLYLYFKSFSMYSTL